MTRPATDRGIVLAWIAEVAAPRAGTGVVRVAVDGITAAGKTTFAGALTDTLAADGLTVLAVSMDGFHHPRAVRHRQGRSSAAGYYEDAYDVAALRRELLDPLGPGGDRQVRTAVIDLAADTPVDRPYDASDVEVLVVDGSFLQRPALAGAWDFVVYLDCPFDVARARGVARDRELLGGEDAAEQQFRRRYHAAQARYLAEVAPAARADVVVDHTDPAAPVVRRDRRRARVGTAPATAAEARAFFAPRAETWNARLGEDLPAIARAVAELAVAPGQAVLDLGCGAGRAFDALRAATGPTGTVVGIDVTLEMLAAAPRGPGVVVATDAARLPLPDASIEAVFAAGIVPHLDDPFAGLVELARVAAPGAGLAIFHPIGRARLADKHHRVLRPDDLLAPDPVRRLLRTTGWIPRRVDDDTDRYLALATRSA